MGNMLYQGLVGVIVGGSMGVLLWIIGKVRGRGLIEEPPPRMTRGEIVAGLRAMIDDPSTDPDERDRALDRLRAFEGLEARKESAGC